jgi:hypothetical protein
MLVMNRIIVFLLVLASNYNVIKAQNNAYIDTTGQVQFTVPYKYSYEFQDGLARVKDVATVNGERVWAYGYINTYGETVIPLKYHQTMDFSEGAAFVKEVKDGKWYLIDKSGNRLGNESYDEVGYGFYDRRCTVCNKQPDGVTTICGWIDPKGKLVIPMKYINSSFREGLCCTTPYDNGLYGYIDTTGKVVIPFTSTQAGTASFENGLARTVIKGKTAVIDKKGNVVIQPLFATMPDFDDMYLIASIGSGYGPFKYTDHKGKTVLPGPYNSARAFKYGVAEVIIQDKSGKEKAGIIDRNGKFVIPAEYEQISNAIDRHGCLYGLKDGVWYAFNTDGSVFPKVPYKFVGEMMEGQLIPYQNPEGLWGYLDKKGNEVMKPQFVKADGFSAEGLARVKLPEGYAEESTLKPHPNQMPDAHRQTNIDQIYLVKYSDGWYYPATFSADGATVNWLEGTSSKNMGSEKREYNWSAGSAVSCNWLKRGTFYEGTIAEVKDGKLFIKYNDGDTEWAMPGQCRCK